MQYDEAYTLHHFAVSPVIALFSYTEPNNHMLHSFLVWMMTSLAGTSLIAVRFPALAMAVLSIALIYRIGRKVAGQRAGIAAAAFLGSNLAFSDYAVNARGYTLSVFLAMLLIDLVFLSSPRPKRWYGYGLIFTSAALIVTLPTLIILNAGVIGWTGWRAKNRDDYRQLLPALIVGTVLGGAFYIPSILYGSLNRSLGRFGYNDLRLFGSEWFNLIFGTPVMGYVLLFLSLIGLVFLLRRSKHPLFGIVSSLFGIAAIAILMQFVFLNRIFYGRNYLYLLPLICLTAAVGLTALTRKWSLGIALLLLLTALSPLQSSLSQATLVDQILAYIHTQLSASDMILVGNFADEPIFYHLRMQDQWDRLSLTPETTRIMVLLEQGGEFTALLDTYQLTPFIDDCRIQDEGKYLFTIYECSLRQASS